MRWLRWPISHRDALPRKVASHEILGAVSDRGATESGLRAGTPVIGGAADHIASALGAGVVSAGDVLLKFGGSVDILTATDHARPDPRLFLDYHLKPGLFVPNGCMATGGSALNWFVRQFACWRKAGGGRGRPLDPSMARSTRRGAARRQRRACRHAVFSRRKDADPRRECARDVRWPYALARHRAIFGAPCSRLTLTRSRIMSRS